mmetsp:Transcript_915/g.1439  ORF Transcript_915/g.1439 Transcript_915/m.1439 type:complete len:353 (+) Transcript_915:39-1097(+)
MGKRKRSKELYGDDTVLEPSLQRKRKNNSMTGDQRLLSYMLKSDWKEEQGKHRGSDRKINYGDHNIDIATNSIEDKVKLKRSVLERYEDRQESLHEYLQDHKAYYKKKYLKNTSQIYVNHANDVDSMENELPQSLRKEIESYNTHDMQSAPSVDPLYAKMISDKSSSSTSTSTFIPFVKNTEPYHFMVAYAVSNRLKRSKVSFVKALSSGLPSGVIIENVLVSRVARDVYFVLRGLPSSSLDPLIRVFKVDGIKKIGKRAPVQHASFSASTRIAFVSNLDASSTHILNFKQSLEKYTGCTIRWMKHLPHLNSAYIRFKHRFGLQKALELNGSSFQGWHLRVNEFKDDMNRFN